ncbi:hypothetical protein P154DRAFT_583098 [Amniculicola lignicola CBS 123094]|uniref:Uncharacterized protein n=1 Tax=Amniculicola lignicola CBS 123094 TaxID=1392246 RepID=A0A6A5VWV2_9PLEO|nr:hypothetical protein P154DRAFT_583098 [Amniculicola lignicola CBS 123094]
MNSPLSTDCDNVPLWLATMNADDTQLGSIVVSCDVIVVSCHVRKPFTFKLKTKSIDENLRGYPRKKLAEDCYAIELYDHRSNCEQQRHTLRILRHLPREIVESYADYLVRVSCWSSLPHKQGRKNIGAVDRKDPRESS